MLKTGSAFPSWRSSARMQGNDAPQGSARMAVRRLRTQGTYLWDPLSCSSRAQGSPCRGTRRSATERQSPCPDTGRRLGVPVFQSQCIASRERYCPARTSIAEATLAGVASLPGATITRCARHGLCRMPLLSEASRPRRAQVAAVKSTIAEGPSFARLQHRNARMYTSGRVAAPHACLAAGTHVYRSLRVGPSVGFGYTSAVQMGSCGALSRQRSVVRQTLADLP